MLSKVLDWLERELDLTASVALTVKKPGQVVPKEEYLLLSVLCPETT